jgi:hypothetical protein
VCFPFGFFLFFTLLVLFSALSSTFEGELSFAECSGEIFEAGTGTGVEGFVEAGVFVGVPAAEAARLLF